MPIDVVVRAGLVVGVELDRATLRGLARELRRHRALATATAALRRRDLSTHALDARLARSGVRKPDRAEALDTLVRAGLVDDDRFAAARATALADRGLGDDAVRWKLDRNGVTADRAERAVERLEPERNRIVRIVEKRGVSQATARLLARRGFSADAIEAAVGSHAGVEP